MSIKQLSEYGIVPTWDLGAVVFLFIFIIFYEVSSGRNKTILSLLGVYFSFAVINFFPFWGWLMDIFGIKESFFLKIPFFLVFTVIFAFLLSKSVGGSFFSFSKMKISQFLQSLLLSVLQTGLLAASAFSFLPDNYYEKLSPLTVAVFIKEPFGFLWVLLPIIGLIIFNTKKSRN